MSARRAREASHRGNLPPPPSPLLTVREYRHARFAIGRRHRFCHARSRRARGRDVRGRARTDAATVATAQCCAVRRRRPAFPDGGRHDCSGDGGAGARGREPPKQPRAVSHFNHRQRLRDGDRPHARQHRGLRQHPVHRLRGRYPDARPEPHAQDGHAVSGKRPGPRPDGRAPFGQFPERDHDPPNSLTTGATARPQSARPGRP